MRLEKQIWSGLNNYNRSGLLKTMQLILNGLHSQTPDGAPQPG